MFVECVKYVDYYQVSYYAYNAYYAYLILICITEQGSPGHSVSSSVQQQCGPYCVIGHTKYSGAMRISSWPFVLKKSRQNNRQDIVLIRQLRISDSAFDSAFQLRMGNIWFCKLLLLFKSVHRHLDAAARVCLCFCAGGEQWAKITRSYSAYYVFCAYTSIHLLFGSSPQPG